MGTSANELIENAVSMEQSVPLVPDLRSLSVFESICVRTDTLGEMNLTMILLRRLGYAWSDDPETQKALREGVVPPYIYAEHDACVYMTVNSESNYRHMQYHSLKQHVDLNKFRVMGYRTIYKNNWVAAD